MRDFIFHNWLPTFLAAILTCIGGHALWKWPKLRAFLQPDQYQRQLTEDRDELQSRCDRLEAENVKLKHGNEFLFDELQIARTVRDNQRDRLDAANAEVEMIRNQMRKVERFLNPDDFKTKDPGH